MAAINLLSCTYEDEEFIDMEVSSSSHSNSNSPSKSREFEFQMATSSIMHSNSPADELFYKGRLLPLHLPPRVQMVKSLLQNAKFKEDDEQQEGFITFSTPMVQSCNISPSESCRVSTELTPDEYFFQWSTELTGFVADNPKKYYGPWSKKLRLIKQCSITQKLKASRSYLKSLFNKSGGYPCAKQDVEQDCDQSFLQKYLKVCKRSGFGQTYTRKCPTLANVLKGIEEQGNEDVFDSKCNHRKSFSGAIKRKCSPSSTSSSSSSSSSVSGSSSSSSSFNGIYELQLLKRNSSADSEVEGSIEAAIDHCKKSHQVYNSNNVPCNDQ
ncbi:hypothetical protein QVD17_36355 [Tagetes erecta]|uniref:Membrane-associated kinase regulator 4 n=1 Tax=Tagetes erecta TaxID=13708 RepID=A0AAD8JW79_TARER|nr:hypothetical protein QVD17_36355 [Tagetes erecta]